jgi:hypothetical protein
MSDPESIEIGAGDVGAVEDLVDPKAERGVENVASDHAKDVTVPQSTVKTLPHVVQVAFGTNVVDRLADKDVVHECAAVSVVVHRQNAQGLRLPAMSSEFGRGTSGDGALLKAPAADLAAAALALGNCLTLADVVDVFLRIFDAGAEA